MFVSIVGRSRVRVSENIMRRGWEGKPVDDLKLLEETETEKDDIFILLFLDEKKQKSTDEHNWLKIPS